MSDRTNALLAAAAAATATLKEVVDTNREVKEEAFRTSALATWDFIKAKGSANALAELNKANGAGYGSRTAVGFHALTGQYLTLPEGEWDGEPVSAQRVQALVKKVGQDIAKGILRSSKTQANAAEALEGAVPEKSIEELLKAAVGPLAKAADLRTNGHAVDAKAQEQLDLILAALQIIVTPASVTVTAPTPAVVAA